MIIFFIVLFRKQEETTSPTETVDTATQEVKSTLKKYNVPEETVNTSNWDKAKDILKETFSDPKFYESVVLQQILKTALFKAEQKGLLKAGSAGAETITKALAEAGFKATAKITEEVGMKMAEMAAGIEAGPPGWLFDVFQIGMLGVDLWDPAGFNQFAANKDIIIPARNAIEQATIKSKNKKPPYIFTIENVTYSQTLKPLYDIFKEGVQQYIISLMDNAVKTIPEKSYDKYLNHTKDNTEFVNVIVEKATIMSNENPSKRDKSIFEYMGSKLPNLKKYINFHSWLSSKDIIGITLSKEGAELFNKETLNNKDVVFMAIYSKYYRDLDQNDNVITKQLQEPITQQSYLKPIMNMCTTSSLTKNMELFKKIPRANVNPGEYGVTFNNDLGICSYTKNYCERFGMIPTSQTIDNLSYKDCKSLPGEEVVSLILGTTLTHGAVFLGEKAVDGVETAYTNAKKAAVDTYGAATNFFSTEGKNIADGLITAGTFVEDQATSTARTAWKTGKTIVNITSDVTRGASEAVLGKKTTKTIEDTATDVIKESQDVARGVSEAVLGKKTTKFIENVGGTIINPTKWFSDSRLKMNIQRIPNKFYGRYILPVYKWEWIPNNKFGLSGPQWGVLASDVMSFVPDAVTTIDGYYYVNYNLIK